MTPFFINAFKKEHKCHNCRAKKAKGRKFCLYHLRIAREKWQLWADIRRIAGKCISCNRKSIKGWLRCTFHREQNRLKCLAWMKAHPEHAHQQWVKRYKTYTLQGLCVSCKEHRPNAPGRARCAICLAKHREAQARNQVTL
jgi:hypothetical protein